MTATAAVNTAIYTRVSSKKQLDGTSLDTQLEMLRKYAAENGLKVVSEYVDGAVSGDLPFDERPDAREMMRACGAGKIDLVIATMVDRFGRDTVETLTAARELKRAGVGLVLTVQGIDTRIDGDMMLGLRAVIAAEEKRAILERTLRGKRARAMAGEWTGGRLPYGLATEPIPGTRSRRLTLDPEEARIARRASRLIVNGDSTWRAAAILNEEGYRRRNRDMWDYVSLRDILRASTLNGVYTWGKRSAQPIDIKIPRVIAAEEYAQLQAALDLRRRGPRPTQGFFELSGGFLIGACGAPFHGVTSNKRGKTRFYRCHNRRSSTHEHARCDDHHLNAELVEVGVWRAILDMLSDSGALLSIADEQESVAGTSDVPAMRADVERRLSTLETTRTERMQRGLLAGIDPVLLQRVDVRLAAEVTELEERLETLIDADAYRQGQLQRAERMRELAATARQRLPEMDARKRHEVLELLRVRATVTGYRECPTCRGRGKLKGGRGGFICATCKAMKVLPNLEVHAYIADGAVDRLLGTASTHYLAKSAHVSYAFPRIAIAV